MATPGDCPPQANLVNGKIILKQINFIYAIMAAAIKALYIAVILTTATVPEEIAVR